MSLRSSIFLSRFALAVVFGTTGIMGTAHADCGGAQPYVICTDVQVTELYITGNGPGYVKVSGNMAALQPACALDGGWIVLRASEPNFKSVYATLLAAQMQSRNVTVRMTANDAACSAAYVVIK